jgi:type IV pilus assembly protein PilP
MPNHRSSEQLVTKFKVTAQVPRVFVLLLFIFFGAVLSGCAAEKNHPDIHQFMKEARNQKGSRVEPLPVAKPYVAFAYSALALRSPFDKPILFVSKELGGKLSSVKPDVNRQKEELEGFNFAALALVGGLSKDGVSWALINDSKKRIHRIREGNYIGKNHGRVVSITSTKVEVIEIVPSGKDTWLERPRTLTLREKE